MTRRHKKKRSKFQKLTIAMAWLMAIITLAAVVMQAVGALSSFGFLNKKRETYISRFLLPVIF